MRLARWRSLAARAVGRSTCGSRHPADPASAELLSTWAVIVAAGSGDRFGGPKQYAPLGGRRVLDWSLAAAKDTCDGIVLVVHPDRAADREPMVEVVVPGGETRSASVRAGLAAVPDSAAFVVVHDAARPLATPDLWQLVLGALDDDPDADGAVPAVAVVDTLREVGGGTVDRSRFVAVQTPQAFRAEPLRRAHATEPEGTDDASLLEAIGGKVLVVEGEAENRKITTPADLTALQGFYR